MASQNEQFESISPDDIDKLLQDNATTAAGSSDDDIKALIADTLGDVPQDEIARMLDETIEESTAEEKENSSSTEDIDSLLKGLSEESIAGLEVEDDFGSIESGVIAGQDDIDKLLQDAADRAAPIQENSDKSPNNAVATQEPAPETPPEPAPEATEEPAESFSQDDIDALLSGGGPKTSEPEPEPEPPSATTDEPAESFSQDDIDALLSGGGPKTPEPEPEPEPPSATAEEPAESFSQDDIDALLSGGGPKTPEPEPEPEPPSATTDEPAESFSQDDIDALLSGGGPKTPEPEPVATDEPAESFSQDDIDALLSGGGPKTPEPEPEPEPPSATTEEPAESFSQDDIDALLSGGGPKTSEPEPAPEPADETAESISQDDIDALLSGSKTQAPEPETSEADSDMVSQDDIDALLSGGTPPAPTAEPAAETSESISQDDIDALLSGGAPAPAKPKSSAATSETVSQDDIDALLAGDDAPIDEPPAPPAAAPKASSPKGFISATPDDIEELTGGNIDPEANLITQEQLDTLYENFDDEATMMGDETARVPEGTPKDTDDSQLISEDDIDALLNEDISADMTMDLGPQDEGGSGLISQSDIDQLLQGDSPEEADDIGSNLVSQDDIDQLLKSDSGGDDESEGLISQSDIDSLLQGTDEPDAEGDEIEDSLISQDDIDQLLKGDFGDQAEGLQKDEGESDLVTQSEIDDLLRGALGDDAAEDNDPATIVDVEVDQVILKEAEEDTDSSEKDPATAWYRSKKILAIASSVAAVLVVSCSFLFWHLYTKNRPADVVEETVATQPGKTPETPVEIAGQIPSFTIDFNGFVVLAPLSQAEVAYLKADVSIKFDKENSVKEIQKHEPYFRSIIYDVLSKELISQKEDEQIDKIALEGSVKSALNKALPEKGIKQITVNGLGVI